MKKILVTILTVAILTSAVAAFADGGPQGAPMGGPGNGPKGGQQMQHQVLEKPSGEKPADAPEKPSEAPEKPTGEKPADAPEEPAYLTGEKPADAPEMPSGEKPSDAPEMPSGEQGQAPQGQQPADGQQGPRMIDFDAMVTNGVISQETRENIRDYMEAHKPEGEKPADASEKSTDGQEQKPDLLNDLLNASIITQAEYDALSDAIKVD